MSRSSSMSRLFGKFLFIAVLTVVVIIFSANPQSAPIAADLTIQKVLAALSGILVFVLLVERTTEMLISVWRQVPTEQSKEELALLKSDVAQSDAAVAQAQALAKYQADTKKIALLTGFTLSIVICSAGVGLVGEVIDISQNNQNFLRGVDIVLTSGLISGGSDAFHQFVRAFETFFTTSKKNMQNT